MVLAIEPGSGDSEVEPAFHAASPAVAAGEHCAMTPNPSVPDQDLQTIIEWGLALNEVSTTQPIDRATGRKPERASVNCPAFPSLTRPPKTVADDATTRAEPHPLTDPCTGKLGGSAINAE